MRRVAPKDDTLEVDFRNSKVTDEHLQYLQALKMVTVVRLRDTPITDAGLLHLGKIATLKRLHLEKTAVTDAGMKHLTGLKELELLNLFGTEVSDAGVEHLKNLPRLKSLFVFQTRVTVAGIARLQKAIPGLQVVPDPATDRQRAEAAWKIARSALDEAEKKFAALKKDAEDLAPQAAQLKKELDDANRQTADLKKKADEFKKRLDDVNRRFNELKGQADLAQKQAEGNPGDLGLKKQAEEKLLLADQAKQMRLISKVAFEEAQKTFLASQGIVQAVQQRSVRASNARKNADEAAEASGELSHAGRGCPQEIERISGLKSQIASQPHTISSSCRKMPLLT